MERSAGLSPRVRGNRSCASSSERKCRSIPACTGEPVGLAGVALGFQVYPRVYGGTPAGGWRHLAGYGLSPRVRGNPLDLEIPGGRVGSIPACTGEPRSWPTSTRLRGVYPRVYGGTNAGLDGYNDGDGLSPRVRGNRILFHCPNVLNRSIPACTGEPIVHRPHPHRTGVYPRVYGGTPVRRWSSKDSCGLSPRVRGNRRDGEPAV